MTRECVVFYQRVCVSGNISWATMPSFWIANPPPTAPKDHVVGRPTQSLLGVGTYESLDVGSIKLLLVVSTVVALATGAIVAYVLPDPQHALISLITSYILL